MGIVWHMRYVIRELILISGSASINHLAYNQLTLNGKLTLKMHGVMHHQHVKNKIKHAWWQNTCKSQSFRLSKRVMRLWAHQLGK